MKSSSIALALFVCALTLAGCKSSDPASANPAPSADTAATPPLSAASPTANPSATASPATPLISKIDPCQLLTADDLKQVQGADLQSASRSDRETGDLVVAQCYYQLPSPTQSVVVNLTTSKTGGKSVREHWRRMFIERKEPEREGKEVKTPDKISNLGEDAYWEGSGVAGALYVLQKDTIFRISVGGGDDIKTKLEKTKTLAQKAVARL